MLLVLTPYWWCSSPRLRQCPGTCSPHSTAHEHDWTSMVPGFPPRARAQRERCCRRPSGGPEFVCASSCNPLPRHPPTRKPQLSQGSEWAPGIRKLEVAGLAPGLDTRGLGEKRSAQSSRGAGVRASGRVPVKRIGCGDGGDQDDKRPLSVSVEEPCPETATSELNLPKRPKLSARTARRHEDKKAAIASPASTATGTMKAC